MPYPLEPTALRYGKAGSVSCRRALHGAEVGPLRLLLEQPVDGLSLPAGRHSQQT
jgi:hypothetical protein